jgi:hypothetical protein
MSEPSDLETRRIHAYEFIKLLFKSVHWMKVDFTEDVNIADALDIGISNLTLLKEGKMNPSPKLVDSIKTFFEDEPNVKLIVEWIDSFLIEPFK